MNDIQQVARILRLLYSGQQINLEDQMIINHIINGTTVIKCGLLEKESE